MALIHARHTDKPPISEEPTEELAPGDIVTLEEGGGAHLTDPEDDDEAHGIVLNYEFGDNIADHPRDFRSGIDDFTYRPVDEDEYEDTLNLAPIALFEDGATVRPYSIQNEDYPSPSIERHSTVGVIVDGEGDQQVVEEGYEAGGETYSEDEGNFVAVGYAKVAAGAEFDEHDRLVPVRT